MSRIQAVLFDIDGTLVDSVYDHVVAWWESFAAQGLSVPHTEIHRRIGKDGGLLVGELMEIAGADRADDSLSSALSSGHDDRYGDRVDQLTVLPGARELVRATKDHGMTVVLATSAPDHELQALRKLLDVDDLVDAVTSSEDVETAKPDGTVVDIALGRARVSASAAVMMGDATWDFLAATPLGVGGIGVCSGGIGSAELIAAGASETYRDPADVLANCPLYA
ncbi:HAD family hydrolase [Williamsia deligens]|uniref:HAD family hydrolase n=1 Tax=Williamsia deligens TaxID=321325 RepID=A0ABW3G593_9NOCA|nr:HAD family hydrolase [Williamsia deligens]MCP2193805.1 Phosphoglycolate phosphatase, HAD superfamily [Williamsia deligens]